MTARKTTKEVRASKRQAEKDVWDVMLKLQKEIESDMYISDMHFETAQLANGGYVMTNLSIEIKMLP
jgi:hypothetical protein